MQSLDARARRAGWLYFLFMIVAILGEFVLPGFVVTGDAAATARNIATSESLYRLSILVGGVTFVIFIYLVASLYHLLKHVDAGYALQMVLVVSIGVAFSFANLALKLVPL